MISSTAKIYANALSKLSLNHSLIINELDFIWNMICRFDASGVITKKSSPLKYKRKIIVPLIQNAKISLTIKKIIKILLDNNKLDTIPKIKNLYEKNVLETENIKQSLIIFSKQIDDKNIDFISEQMKQKFGHNFKFEVEIDENIIDGFIMKFDDFVLDLSLRGKLNKITQKIKNL